MASVWVRDGPIHMGTKQPTSITVFSPEKRRLRGELRGHFSI